MDGYERKADFLYFEISAVHQSKTLITGGACD